VLPPCQDYIHQVRIIRIVLSEDTALCLTSIEERSANFNNPFKRVSIEKSVCSFRLMKIYVLFEINVSGYVSDERL